MLRIAASVVAGVVVYVILASVGLYLLRVSWPAYAAVEANAAFDLPMQIARLVISSLTLLVAAWVTGRIARASRAGSVILGVLLLAASIPIHVSLWDKYPLWYHLTYFVSLMVLSLLGGAIGRGRGVVAGD